MDGGKVQKVADQRQGNLQFTRQIPVWSAGGDRAWTKRGSASARRLECSLLGTHHINMRRPPHYDGIQASGWSWLMHADHGGLICSGENSGLLLSLP